MGTTHTLAARPDSDENLPDATQDGKPAPSAPLAAGAANVTLMPRDPDWERIGVEYEAGILSLREIARASTESGAPCTHTRILAEARRRGWVRDNRKRVQLRAEDLITIAQMERKKAEDYEKLQTTTALRAAGVETVPPATLERMERAEEEIVEFRSKTIAEVRGAQQRDIHRCRALAMRLWLDLESQVVDQLTHETIAELVLTVDVPEGDDEQAIMAARRAQVQAMKRRAQFDAVLSLPERSKTIKNLTEVIERLVGLESKAYGIVQPKESEEPPPSKDTGTARDHYEWLCRQRPA